MSFSQLIGQTQAIDLLQSAIDRHRIAPGYLFAGPTGIGKSLAATGFLTQVLAKPGETPAHTHQRITDRNHPDLLWVEPTYLDKGKRLTPAEAEAAGLKRKTAPIVRLEQVREIAQFLSRPPLEAARSAIVIDQADTMNEAAANALLKTLEEPGPATLILLTPQIESLLPTIVSRCQRIPFRRLDPEAMALVLTRCGQTEVLAQPQILALAAGSPGKAIEHWERLQTLPEDLLATVLAKPTNLIQALTLAKQIAKGLDSETQLWLVDYLQQIAYQNGTELAYLQALEQAKQYLSAYVQPQLVWEVTLMGQVA
jgi:DNA polymerase III subunit delta'